MSFPNQDDNLKKRITEWLAEKTGGVTRDVRPLSESESADLDRLKELASLGQKKVAEMEIIKKEIEFLDTRLNNTIQGEASDGEIWKIDFQRRVVVAFSIGGKGCSGCGSKKKQAEGDSGENEDFLRMLNKMGYEGPSNDSNKPKIDG